VSQTIKISKLTKILLTRYTARLEEKLGRKISFDEALRHLLISQDKRPKLLAEVLGSIPSVSSDEIFHERRLDEERRAKRLYL